MERMFPRAPRGLLADLRVVGVRGHRTGPLRLHAAVSDMGADVVTIDRPGTRQ